jgi:chromosome segregation ATPase
LERDATLEQIVKFADDARALIQQEQKDVTNRSEAILRAARDRNLTAEEEAQVKALGDLRGKLNEANVQLALVTAQALNNSAKVGQITESIKRVNSDLDEALNKAGRIAASIGNATEILGSIAKLLGGLTKLIALV